MAKKKKKDKGSDTGLAAVMGGGTLLGEIIGNTIGQLLRDGMKAYLNPDERHGKKSPGRHDESASTHAADVTPRLLQTLSDEGPQPLPELVAATRVPLGELLRAMQLARKFRLIEFSGTDEETVQLTPVGSRTATVLRSGHIRKSAARVLGE